MFKCSLIKNCTEQLVWLDEAAYTVGIQDIWSNTYTLIKVLDDGCI